MIWKAVKPLFTVAALLLILVGIVTYAHKSVFQLSQQLNQPYKMNDTLIGSVSADQIAKWKQEHKIDKIFQYKVEGRICYLKPVDRDTYSIAATKVSVSPAKFNEEVVKRIWLGGDEDIRKKDDLYFGLIDHIETLMDKKKGELGEL